MKIKENLIAKAIIKDTNWKVVRRYIYFLDKDLRQKLNNNQWWVTDLIESTRARLINNFKEMFNYEIQFLKYKIEIEIVLKCFIY